MSDYNPNNLSQNAAIARAILGKNEGEEEEYRDALTVDDDDSQDAPEPKKPAADHNAIINPNKGQNMRITSDVETKAGKPTFTTSYGSEILDPAYIDGKTVVTIGNVTTNVAAAMKMGLLEKTLQGEYVLTDAGKAHQGKSTPAPKQGETTVAFHHRATLNQMRQRVEVGSGINIDSMIGHAATLAVQGDKTAEFNRLVNDIADAVKATPESVGPFLDEYFNDSLESALRVASRETGIGGDELWNRLIKKASHVSRSQFVRAAISGDTSTVRQMARSLRFNDTLK